MANDVSRTSFTDGSTIPVGTGYYYLTRFGGSLPGLWNTGDPKQRGLANDTLESSP